MRNISLTTDSTHSSTSTKDLALTSSDAVSSQEEEGEGSCEGTKTVATVATGLGAAIADVIASSVTVGPATPIAVARLLGAANALTNLWSCPGFAERSYKEFKGLMKQVIDEHSAGSIVNIFKDIEEDLGKKCPNIATDDKVMCLDDKIGRLKTVMTEIDSNNIIYVLSRIKITATLEYSKLMLFKIMRADPDEITHDCKINWVNSYYTEIEQVINRIEEAYDWQLKTSDHVEYEKLFSKYGYFVCSAKICFQSTHDHGRFSLRHLGLHGCTSDDYRWCRRDDSPSLRYHMKLEYPNSKAFDWWRAIEPDMRALKEIRDSPRQKLVNMC